MSAETATPERRASEPWQEPDNDVLSLVEGLASEMAQRWRQGERPRAEEFFARHPELNHQPEAALELIAEELALRQETGLRVDLVELRQRFPQWERQVEILARCHDLLAPVRLPAVGETLGDFHLLAELGRGAVGRVYLASQPSLAGRPVVVKLSPACSGEHLSLARLQHTHIVPLFSVHEFPTHGLYGLCLPYLGGVTLDAILKGLHDQPPAQRTGRALLTALQGSPQVERARLPVGGPACRFLEQATYVQAVCWIGMCLAEALQYAHERDLLHLDVKPSNVLLAADGQPLLLDFHLARARLVAGQPPPTVLGGTPSYMAPEQRAALDAVHERRPIPQDVDGRADVYALALVLYEALGGRLPVPSRTAADLRVRNSEVTTGLADLLAKCLAPAPGQRYASAGDLAADLRRYLADLPLRGVANRSSRERWQRWRRRRPYAVTILGLGAAALTGAVLLFGHVQRQSERAESALQDGVRAERLQAAAELHQSCEQMRSLYGVELSAGPQAHAVESTCARLWQNRDRIVQGLGGLPTVDLDEQLRDDLLDVAILWADVHVRLHAEDACRAHEEALAVLAQADALFGPCCVLAAEQREHRRALGLPDLGEDSAPAPRNAWEHYALGRLYLRRGETERATVALDRALALKPQALWANFYKGRCAFQAGAYDDAAAAFSVCAALAPDSAWAVYHRGLAFLEQGRLERARSDFDTALRLDPSLLAAVLGRGIVHYRQKHSAEALADLRRVLELEPAHEQARKLLAQLEQHP